MFFLQILTLIIVKVKSQAKHVKKRRRGNIDFGALRITGRQPL